MPTLQEIELRAQLARRDERINLLERELEAAEKQLAMAIADCPPSVRDEIASLRNQLDNAKAVAKSAMAELSSLTIAQQACIGCTGDGYDSFGMRCFGPPPVSECKDVPAGDAAIFAIASVKGGA